MKFKCGLCGKRFPKDQMFHELDLWFNSLCYFYLDNYRLDNERTHLFDAIKMVKSLGGKYIG